MKLFSPMIISCLMIMTFSAYAETQKKSSIAVVIETTAGNINVDLYADKAPISVASFLEAVDSNHFDRDGAFYRVVTPENDNGLPVIEVIQGGIKDYKKSLPLIAHETTEQTGLLHMDGTISLARGNGSTGSGSTFFICIGDQPSLDYGGKRYADGQGFAAFGKVTKGMDIVRRIQKMETQTAAADKTYQQQLLVQPIKIIKVYRK